ncbi:peptidase C39 family protein [Segeticoccus rhizosphaerae]|jgi:hypothetical protein|uniref:peptidase C39 family protein n=1 Tax=Segeticoccus rhizosphaerae TaxID=1104777 RepID=UPI001EE4746E|nr:peptidase C39 family protein [Ornithinicoccus soli]
MNRSVRKSRIRLGGTTAVVTLGCLALLATSPGAASAAPVLTGKLLMAAADQPAGQRDILYRQFSGHTLAQGHGDGVQVTPYGLRIERATGTMTYTDPFGDGAARTYDTATWVSPHVATTFGLEQLIASYNASTPMGTWIQVEMRGHSVSDEDPGGHDTKWYTMARWASSDEHIHRTTVDGQGDDDGTVWTDTFAARGSADVVSYQLRVTLLRPAGTHQTPTLRSVGAVASRLPSGDDNPASPLGGAEGITLDVPTYSQEKHIGEYPQWDGGGEAWCSATSTAMVVDYFHKGPNSQEMSWVDPSYADPQVDFTARNVFDYTYDGTGNWPFNTAYASTRGLNSFVTRLRSLTEAEQFIKAGIPLVVSLSFSKDDLDGAGYGTNGHLMVLVGFDKTGNVVVNDPASHLIPSNDQVRFTYDRKQFENAWSHSGKTVYVNYPRSKTLPQSLTPDQPNW